MNVARSKIKSVNGEAPNLFKTHQPGNPLLFSGHSPFSGFFDPYLLWLTMAEPQHDKDAVHREVLRIWQQHRHAQEQLDFFDLRKLRVSHTVQQFNRFCIFGSLF